MARRNPTNPQLAQTKALIDETEQLLADAMDLLGRVPRDLDQIRSHIVASTAAIEASRQRLRR